MLVSPSATRTTTSRQSIYRRTHLVHVLNVDDAEDEDELVKDEVPELVLELCLLRDSQFAEHALLYGLPQQDQQAVGHVDQRLKQQHTASLGDSSRDQRTAGLQRVTWMEFAGN